ncbi:MAG: OsmC family protein [Cyclobacteriaceae bacterium]
MGYTHSYTINLSWQHDRQGLLASNDLDQQLEVATPPPFPKGVERVWSPEHLFTAAISSCLMTTFLAIAENFKLDFESFTCPATGKLDQVEGRYRMTEVILEPVVTIVDAKDESKALRVLEKAEAACLITNSVTAKVTMKPRVVIVNLEAVL